MAGFLSYYYLINAAQLQFSGYYLKCTVRKQILKTELSVLTTEPSIYNNKYFLCIIGCILCHDDMLVSINDISDIDYQYHLMFLQNPTSDVYNSMLIGNQC